MAAQDVHSESDRTDFFMTFNTAGEFPQGFSEYLVTWHVRKCSQAVVVAEGWTDLSDERPHFHSVGSFKTEKTSNVVKMIVKLYADHDVEYRKGISVVVKKVTDLIGIWHYLTKDVTAVNPALLVLGWRMSFIKQQCLENLHKIPRKVLMKNKFCLSTKSATACVMAYAKAKAHVLSGKESFASLICLMAADGYQFEAVKIKWLYTQCMSLTGDPRPMRSLILNELTFLD